MKPGKLLIPILTMLGLLGCAQDSPPPSAAAPTVASSGGQLKAQDVVNTATSEVIINGAITKIPGQYGTFQVFLTPTDTDGVVGCNANTDPSDGKTNIRVRLSSNSNGNLRLVGEDTPKYFNGCGIENAYTYNYEVNAFSQTGITVDITIDVIQLSSDGLSVFPISSTPGRLAVKIIAPQSSDTTPPVIVPNITGTLGKIGWYNSDVYLTWSVIDEESEIVTPDCPIVGVFNTDTQPWLTLSSTCTAASLGGAATKTVVVRRDANGPVVTPGNVVAAWRNVPLSQDFTAYDWYSGLVDQQDATFTLTVGAQSLDAQTPTTVSKTVEDNNGNITTRILSALIDTTKPTISMATFAADGTTPIDPNANGWFNQNVVVKFTCADALSGVANCPEPVIIASDTPADGQSVSGTATDSAGNTSASVSQNIKIDKTAPTISASRSPAANPAGWNNTDMTVTFTCSGGTCPAPVTVSANTPTTGQTVSGTVTDPAGNSATASVTVKLDKTAPEARIAATSAPDGLNGWYRSTVNFMTAGSSDAGSGLADCTAPNALTTDITGAVVSTTCTDLAGNSDSASVTVRRDATAPAITAAPVRAANGAGWYNADVNVAFSCSDATSGVSGVCPASQTVSAEGTTPVSASVTDQAGNTSASTALSVKLDKTAPVLTLPANLSVAGTTATAVNYVASASDPLSGTPGISCTPASGSAFPVGSSTVSCSASDAAGNTATGSFTVTVAVRYTFSGFLQPVDVGTGSTVIYNTVKVGGAVPVKFSLGGNQGLNIFVAGSPSAVAVNCATNAAMDDIEELSAATVSGLQYDATTGLYTYVWKTSSAYRAGLCYQLNVRFADGTTKSAYFKFK